mgnify:CR=1 FL=1
MATAKPALLIMLFLVINLSFALVDNDHDFFIEDVSDKHPYYDHCPGTPEDAAVDRDGCSCQQLDCNCIIHNGKAMCTKQEPKKFEEKCGSGNLCETGLECRGVCCKPYMCELNGKCVSEGSVKDNSKCKSGNWVEQKVKEPPLELPDTGIDSIYSYTGVEMGFEIAEDERFQGPQGNHYFRYYGQDGSYHINPPAYTKLDENGNPLPDTAKGWTTVKDRNTGLVWEVKTEENKDKLYTLQEAKEYVKRLNEENFGGFDDWRVPGFLELMTIIDHSQNYYYHFYNTNYFPNEGEINENHDAPYLSSQKQIINFDTGSIFKSRYPRLFRAVRGKPLGSGKLVEKKDTVFDPSTHLEWQRESKFNKYVNAVEYCHNLNLRGKSDWRLPNMKEYISLGASRSREELISAFDWPETNERYDIRGGRYYMSSSSKINYPSHAYTFCLEDAFGTYQYRNHAKTFICVRGGYDKLFNLNVTVKDKATGRPVEGIDFYLETIRRETDENGNVYISNIDIDNNYRVKVIADKFSKLKNAYKPYIIERPFTKEGTIHLDIELEPKYYEECNGKLYWGNEVGLSMTKSTKKNYAYFIADGVCNGEQKIKIINDEGLAQNLDKLNYSEKFDLTYKKVNFKSDGKYHIKAYCNGKPLKSSYKIDVRFAQSKPDKSHDSKIHKQDTEDEPAEANQITVPFNEVNLSSATGSGTNSRVSFCGYDDMGRPKKQTATCIGKWSVDPCNWKSRCSTGWKDLSHTECEPDCETQKHSFVPQSTPVGTRSSYSGHNAQVTFCGVNENGEVVTQQATCHGNYHIDVCDWTSECGGGWQYASTRQGCDGHSDSEIKQLCELTN